MKATTNTAAPAGRPLPRSEDLMTRAKRVIPGGVNSPVRAFGAVGGTPPFIARARGARSWDVDGNEYIDYVGSWGPMILGHAHPAVVEAVREAAGDGTSFGAPTEREVELAELICELRAVGRDGAARQLRHRGHDDRRAPGAGRHRPRQDRQVRGLLPRPRRRVPDQGRLGRGHLRRADEPRACRRARPPTR